MDKSQGFMLAGGLFILAGVIQIFTTGPIGAAFIAVGAAFVAMSVKAKKSEGDDDAR